MVALHQRDVRTQPQRQASCACVVVALGERVELVRVLERLSKVAALERGERGVVQRARFPDRPVPELVEEPDGFARSSCGRGRSPCIRQSGASATYARARSAGAPLSLATASVRTTQHSPG